jgi:hypothetical protein
VSVVFSAITNGTPFNSATLGNLTLREALSLQGGPGVQGGAQNLLRAGVAAYLNAVSGIGYPLTAAQVVAMVNAALDSNDRATMLALAAQLDAYNNLPETNCTSAFQV